MSEPSKSTRHRMGTKTIDATLVRVMQSLATGRTDETLNARFGISYNSWCKIIAGQPLRASLADRLEQRIRHLEKLEVGASQPVLQSDR